MSVGDQEAPEGAAPSDPTPESAEREGQLQDLEGRIRELQRPKRGNSELAHGLSLVFSLGLMVGITLYLGSLLGAWLKREWHSDLLQVVALLGSVALAGFGSYKLLQPLLRK